MTTRPPLDRHVAGIWLTRRAVPVAAETVLPNGVVELILNLGPAHRVVGAGGDRWYHQAWLAGIHQGPLVIASQGWTDLVGIRFRPGGAAALLDVPLGSVADDVVDLDALGRRDSTLARLRDRNTACGVVVVRARGRARLRGPAPPGSRVPHLRRVSPRGFLASRLADQAHLDASAVVADPGERRGGAGRASVRRG